MNRPPLEVAALVRAAGRVFIERSRRWITWQHLTVLRAIARCRTAAAPLSCRFAFNYSTQSSHRNPNQKRRQPSSRIHFGAVPNVAAPWWSSKDLLLPSSNFVLPPGLPEPRHETPIPISLARCLPAPSALVRPDCPPPSSWLEAFARKLQSN